MKYIENLDPFRGVFNYTDDEDQDWTISSLGGGMIDLLKGSPSTGGYIVVACMPYKPLTTIKEMHEDLLQFIVKKA